MNRRANATYSQFQRVPRASGDEPVERVSRKGNFGVFPAPAGMNRLIMSNKGM